MASIAFLLHDEMASMCIYPGHPGHGAGPGPAASASGTGLPRLRTAHAAAAAAGSHPGRSASSHAAASPLHSGSVRVTLRGDRARPSRPAGDGPRTAQWSLLRRPP